MDENAVVAYTVTFQTESGVYREETVSAGRMVNKPPVPERDGYEFTGWYRDEALTLKCTFPLPVCRSMRLYAGWKHKSYFVRFMAGGLANPTTQVVRHGSLVSEPDLYFPGYRLEGWYTEETCVNRYDFNTKVTRNYLLYAKWKQH